MPGRPANVSLASGGPYFARKSAAKAAPSICPNADKANPTKIARRRRFSFAFMNRSYAANTYGSDSRTTFLSASSTSSATAYFFPASAPHPFKRCVVIEVVEWRDAAAHHFEFPDRLLPLLENVGNVDVNVGLEALRVFPVLGVVNAVHSAVWRLARLHRRK